MANQLLGSEAACFGLDAFMPMFTEIVAGWGEGPLIMFEIREPVLSSGELAVTFVDLIVRLSETSGQRRDYHCLFAWRNGTNGWRIAREAFAEGRLG